MISESESKTLVNNNRLSEFYLFLAGLFLCPVMFYPYPNHINGKDSFVMYSIADDILINGFCPYLINVFSYMGLFPNSYAAAAPFFGAIISLVLNLNLELSVLVINLSLYYITFSASFFLGKKITKSSFGALILGVTYSTARVSSNFIGDWNFSTRIMTLSIVPVIILLLVNYLYNKDRRILYMSFFIVLISFTFHRTSYFLALVFIIYIINLFINNYFKREKISKILVPRERYFFVFLHSLLLLLFLSPLIIGRFFYLEGPRVINNPYFTIIDSENFFAIFVNLIANYALGFGLLFILIVPGFYSLYKDVLLLPLKRFILSFIIFSSFLWVELVYARLFLTILLAILVSYGAVSIFNYIRGLNYKNSISAAFVIILIFAQISPIFITINNESIAYSNQGMYDEEQIKEIISLSHDTPEETIDMSNYLQVYKSDREMFSNFEYAENQIRAFAGLGSPNNLHSVRSYERYDLSLNSTNIIAILIGEKVTLGVVTGPEYPMLKYSVFTKDPELSNQYISKAIDYNIGPTNNYYFVVIVSSSPENLVWEEEKSPFLIQLNQDSYKVYSNSFLDLTYYNIGT